MNTRSQIRRINAQQGRPINYGLDDSDKWCELCIKQHAEIERLRDKIRLLEWYKETGVTLAKEVAWLRRENELLTRIVNGKDDRGG